MIPIWPVAHFFWGYSVSLPIILLFYWLIRKEVKVKNVREYLKKRAIFGAFGGLWAMIPDIDYFLEDYIFSDKTWSDIFVLHISLDKVLPETDLFFAAEMFLMFAVINLLAITVIVESFHRLNEAIFGKKADDDDDEEDEDDEDKEDEVMIGDENEVEKEEEDIGLEDGEK